MNAIERLLQNDLNQLVDRIAATIPSGMLEVCAQRRPDLRRQLGEAETRLSIVRQSLLGDYSAWRHALEECADLWALVESCDSTERPASEVCAA